MQRSGFRAAVPAVVLAVVAACAPGCGGSGIAVDCNPPCAIDEVCVDGVCVPVDPADGTEFVADVPEDEGGGAADDGPAEASPDDASVPDDASSPDDAWRPDITATNVGEPCASPDECRVPGEPNCITEISVFGMGIPFANGYCSGSCDPGNPDSCGPGATCVSLSWIGLDGCMKTCSSASPGDCREDEGYTCFDLGSWGMGLPAICSPRLF